MAEKPVLQVLLCSPRGFCAGVVRAIESVERALAIYGAPVYVRHEIVHNRYVVDSLRKKGAIFVEELSEIPDSEAPVVFSHSGAFSVNPHARNVPDDILQRVTGNGGVVMAVFLTGFVSDEVRRHLQPGMDLADAYERDHPDATPEQVREVRREWMKANPPPPATVAQVADHIDHLAKMAGVEHVGIGSDFDGGEPLPIGLEDVSRFPNLIAELLRRGYSDDEVRGITGGNVLRVMRGAESAAQRIQAERPPSEATIEELDG